MPSLPCIHPQQTGHPPPPCTGIYFSAHWCPPCRAFTPKLRKTYEALTMAGKPFEVVFASSDQSQAQFLEYYAQMPWAALPFGAPEKAELSRRFGVSSMCVRGRGRASRPCACCGEGRCGWFLAIFCQQNTGRGKASDPLQQLAGLIYPLSKFTGVTSRAALTSVQASAIRHLVIPACSLQRPAHAFCAVRHWSSCPRMGGSCRAMRGAPCSGTLRVSRGRATRTPGTVSGCAACSKV